MFQAHGISKRFAARPIINGLSFVVNAGERLGVVGPNGCGKTTLLRIMAGVEPTDEGSVTATGSAVGYLPQGYADRTADTVGEVFPGAFASSIVEARVERLSAALANASDPVVAEALSEEYSSALLGLAEASSRGGPRDVWRVLQLRAIVPNELLGTLSGGEQTKLGLIDLVAAQPTALLLDEPTNNLDIDAIAWLDAYLRAFAGAVILVSHDRALLDDHATSTLELDPATGTGEVFAGDYTTWVAEKARRADEAWTRYRTQQARERRVMQEVRDIKATAARRERGSRNDFYRRKAKKVARRGVVLERRLTRELDAERLDKPLRRAYALKTALAPAARSGDRMLGASSLTIAAGGRTLLADAELQIGWGERIVLLGANGVGKTSLLRVLAGEARAQRGDVRLSPSTRIGYLPQNEHMDDGAHGDQTPLAVVRAASELSETEARRFLHRFLFSGDDALRPAARLSYGERRRLALALVVLSGANLLLLDEPTNHLDLPSREAFESALEQYEGAMLCVTHDRYFINRFAQRLLVIDEGRLSDV